MGGASCRARPTITIQKTTWNGDLSKLSSLSLCIRCEDPDLLSTVTEFHGLMHLIWNVRGQNYSFTRDKTCMAYVL